MMFGWLQGRGLARLSLLVATLAAAIPATAGESEQTSGVGPARGSSAACGDFMRMAGVQAPELAFVACKSLEIHGLPAFRAEYRVAGAQAGEVEALLTKRAQMPPLRYLCCGWESQPADPAHQSPAGSLTIGGNRFEVSMTSGETMVNRRGDWAKIPVFEVYVVRYLD
jgi:hypothetical protein